MSEHFELFLARLYTDEAMRDAFARDPDEVTQRAELSPAEIDAARKIDRVGLLLFAASLAHKRTR